MTEALPEWLLALQTVTWLATGNLGLTLQARPGPIATADPEIEIAALQALPIETWLPELRGLRQQYLEYTGAVPRTLPREALSLGPSERLGLAGAASDWSNGFSLSYLAYRTGNWPQPHIRRLVDAARSGKVATVDAEGKPIGSTVWNRHSMREALRRPGVLIMVPDPYHQIDEDTAVEPLFRRDDVLRLDVATEASPTTPGSAQTTDEEVAEFIKGKRAEWFGAGKKHGRDRLLAEAARRFHVRRKYVLDIWNRKRLGKNCSTPKRR
jgi:hypothetical protein